MWATILTKGGREIGRGWLGQWLKMRFCRCPMKGDESLLLDVEPRDKNGARGGHSRYWGMGMRIEMGI